MADPSRVRVVDEEISLVPYYPNEETALPWYQDPDVCRQVDNIDHVYTSERLSAMYTYLSTHGACYYISYRGVLVGAVSLRNSGELAIVICREYQNRHIGRRCIRETGEERHALDLGKMRLFWTNGLRCGILIYGGTDVFPPYTERRIL